MKLINNQETRLFEEIIPLLQQDSEVYICLSYFSIPAIYELSPLLAKAKVIKMLIDSNAGQDLRFAYDNAEYKDYLSLQSRYKADQALTILKDQCDSRQANVRGQNSF